MATEAKIDTGDSTPKMSSTLSSADRAIRIGGSAAGASLFGGVVGASVAGPVGAVIGAIVGGAISSGVSYAESSRISKHEH